MAAAALGCNSPAPIGTSSPTFASDVPTPSTAVSTGTPPPTHVGAPNILLVIADDFGIDASPCYDIGLSKPEMPNLEKLCNEGVVFDNAWVNPMCTPTRASLLSGQYGFRTDVVQVTDALDPDTETIQDVLSAQVPAPYENAVVGKWHVSGDEDVDPNSPADYGVQHFAGFLSGAVEDYFTWDGVVDGEASTINEYTTTWMTDRAIEWLDQRQDRPWFLWLAYNAPHWPYHLPPAELTHSAAGLSGTESDIEAHPVPYFLASAEALDTELGRLLDSIAPEVLANTTILFMGDNGTEQDTSQAPFAEDRSKYSIYDGGLHVPLVVTGRGVTRQSEREATPVNGVDITATILHMAGYENATFHDGLAFDAALTESTFEGRDFVYSDSIRAEPFDGRPGWTVRNEQYQLIEYDDGQRELYDLTVDPGERNNLLRGTLSPELESLVEEMEAYQQSL